MQRCNSFRILDQILHAAVPCLRPTAREGHAFVPEASDAGAYQRAGRDHAPAALAIAETITRSLQSRLPAIHLLLRPQRHRRSLRFQSFASREARSSATASGVLDRPLAFRWGRGIGRGRGRGRGREGERERGRVGEWERENGEREREKERGRGDSWPPAARAELRTYFPI